MPHHSRSLSSLELRSLYLTENRVESPTFLKSNPKSAFETIIKKNPSSISDEVSTPPPPTRHKSLPATHPYTPHHSRPLTPLPSPASPGKWIRRTSLDEQDGLPRYAETKCGKFALRHLLAILTASVLIAVVARRRGLVPPARDSRYSGTYRTHDGGASATAREGNHTALDGAVAHDPAPTTVPTALPPRSRSDRASPRESSSLTEVGAATALLPRSRVDGAGSLESVPLTEASAATASAPPAVALQEAPSANGRAKPVWFAHVELCREATTEDQCLSMDGHRAMSDLQIHYSGPAPKVECAWCGHDRSQGTCVPREMARERWSVHGVAMTDSGARACRER